MIQGKTSLRKISKNWAASTFFTAFVTEDGEEGWELSTIKGKNGKIRSHAYECKKTNHVGYTTIEFDSNSKRLNLGEVDKKATSKAISDAHSNAIRLFKAHMKEYFQAQDANPA